MRYHKKHEDNPFNKDSHLMIRIKDVTLLSKMSKTALRLYLYIREYTYVDEELIIFNKTEAKKVCGFKQDKSIYNALSELIDLEILAGTKDPFEFYYNPKYIAKGE